MTAIFLIGVIIATLWFAFMLVLSGSYENSDEESDEDIGTIGTCKIPTCLTCGESRGNQHS